MGCHPWPIVKGLSKKDLTDFGATAPRGTGWVLDVLSQAIKSPSQNVDMHLEDSEPVPILGWSLKCRGRLRSRLPGSGWLGAFAEDQEQWAGDVNRAVGADNHADHHHERE